MVKATAPLSGDAIDALDAVVVPATRRRVETLAHDVRTWQAAPQPILEHVLGELGELLDLGASAAHSLSPTIAGWHVDFLYWLGPGTAAKARASWSSGLSKNVARPCGFDPVRPRPSQRNRALRPKTTRGPGPFAVDILLEKMGLMNTDELRVIVCDGPALLAWVGGWREAPFTRREGAILQALVPALRERLRLERDLGHAGLHRAALETLFQTHEGAALLVRHDGVVVMLNDAGAAILADREPATGEALKMALSGKATPGYRVLPVKSRGMPLHHLVLMSAALPVVEVRLQELSQRWGLTKRQRAVLRLLVDGASNKTVATKLAAGLRTVEQHVSAVLKKAGLQRRGELTAVFWSGH